MDVGSDDKFGALSLIASLRTPDDRTMFPPQNLLAIDPEMPDEHWLAEKERIGMYEPGFLARFQRLRILVQEEARRIAQGQDLPFDVITCFGVISSGNMGQLMEDFDHDVQALYALSLEIIAAIRDCLSDNPNAVLVLSAKSSQGFLFCTRQHLADLGLEVVAAQNMSPHVRNSWVSLLQDEGVFQDTQDQLFNTVICRKKNR